MAERTHWLIERIRSFDDRPFLADENGVATFTELQAAIVSACSSMAEAGVKTGETIAILGDYSTSAIAWLLAGVQENCIVVPLTALPEDERNSRLRECFADWLVDASLDAISRLERSAERHGLMDALAARGHSGLILFSSGSTGKPKAIIHDLESLLAPYEKRRPRAMAFLVFLLFDHIGGLNTLFNCLASGALMVVSANREADPVASLIERHRVSVLPASPTFLNLLLMSGSSDRHDLSSLRIITYGTEPMPESLLKRLHAAFPRVKFLQTFGTSETGISHTVSKSSDSTLLKIEDENHEYKVVDGELWLRSNTQTLGYLNASSERFTEDGWFRTGDLAEETDDGFLRITGRRSELINVGGEKVMPGEVESCLLALPEVRDCLVYGEANAITGQTVAAEIVANPGADPRALKRSIRRHCAKHLARYKMPTKISFVEETGLTGRFKKVRPKS